MLQRVLKAAEKDKADKKKPKGTRAPQPREADGRYTTFATPKTARNGVERQVPASELYLTAYGDNAEAVANTLNILGKQQGKTPYFLRSSRATMESIADEMGTKREDEDSFLVSARLARSLDLAEVARNLNLTEFDSPNNPSLSSSSSSSSSSPSTTTSTSSSSSVLGMAPSHSESTPSDQVSAPAGDMTILDADLEARQGQLMEDAVTRGTARALAGLKSDNTATGYLGSRNLENGDVLNSSATGTNQVSAEERKGDAFIQAKETVNTATDTMRPSYGIAPANGVIPTKRQQVESDLLFNDFSVVAPGFGLGVTNKMFLMEEERQKKVVYQEPLAEPRKYDGPTNGANVVPLQLQNQITRRDRHTLAAQEFARESSAVVLEQRVGTGSLNVLGDDFGLLQRVSDKGLKRAADSPLEPIMVTPKAWERVKALPGVQWANKKVRRLFDAQRYPDRFDPNIAMEGGPTMGKRNALSVFPFPLST